jgi:hypothetical protein
MGLTVDWKYELLDVQGFEERIVGSSRFHFSRLTVAGSSAKKKQATLH